MDTEAFQEVASQQILQLAKQEEAKLDAKLQQLENLDEDDFDKLRAKRLANMKKAELQKAQFRHLGHGSYSELPNQQAFFEAVKRSPRMIVHFYRPTTHYCEVVDAHMERLAATHLETRFCKLNAEKSPYLVEKLNIFMMPTLVLIKDAETVHHIRGFDEFGGTADFSSDMFAYVLNSYNVLFYDGGRPESPTRAATKAGVNAIRMLTGAGGLKGKKVGSSIREGLNEKMYDSDESADEEDY